MSFYRGTVVKIIPSGTEINVWLIIDLIYVDTDSDDNIHIDFSNDRMLRAAFIPTAWIKNFDEIITKKIKRSRCVATDNEVWEATI